MAKVTEKKDAINGQIDLLAEELDRINEFYDGEIKKVEEFYDAEIKKAEEYYDEQIKAVDAQIDAIDKQIKVRKYKDRFEYSACRGGKDNPKSMEDRKGTA